VPEHGTDQDLQDPRHAGEIRADDVAVEPFGLGPIELDRGDLRRMTVQHDLPFPGGPQVADPMDVAVRTDHEATAVRFGHGDRHGPRLPRRAAADGEQGIRAHRHTKPEQAADEPVGSPDVAGRRGRPVGEQMMRAVHVVPRGHIDWLEGVILLTPPPMEM